MYKRERERVRKKQEEGSSEEIFRLEDVVDIEMTARREGRDEVLERQELVGVLLIWAGRGGREVFDAHLFQVGQQPRREGVFRHLVTLVSVLDLLHRREIHIVQNKNLSVYEVIRMALSRGKRLTSWARLSRIRVVCSRTNDSRNLPFMESTEHA